MRLLILSLLLLGCEEEIKRERQEAIDYEVSVALKEIKMLHCAWSDKYHSCFCAYYIHPHNGGVTWVPDKVCNK